MQKNNSTNYLQEDEIDLKEIFKLLINSKKLIITITLVITTLGAIYGFQKAPEYKSTALIEIGQYDTFENKNILLESTSKLIQNLNIAFIHKSDDDYDSLSTKGIEQKLIKIEIHKPSIELAEKKLEEIIRYIENRHSLLLNDAENQLTYEIKSLNDQIQFTKLGIANQIKSINDQIPTIDLKIKALSTVILEDENNLKLLESNPDSLIQRAIQSPSLNQIIHSYKNTILDLKAEKIQLLQGKDNLETQLKFLESNDLESEEIFKLSQEKDNLERRLERLESNVQESKEILRLSKEKDNLQFELEFLFKKNQTNTQLIGEIVTNEVTTKKELIILLSFIFGFFLSIAMVLIYNSLKALKEK